MLCGMVGRAERIMDAVAGIVVKTSGEVGAGPWIAGQQTSIGWISARHSEGQKYLVFRENGSGECQWPFRPVSHGR